MDNSKKYPHYFKQLPEGTTHVDVYALLRLYNVTDPALAHAIKKLLCYGQRGAKDRRQDLCEARDSIVRAIELHDAFEAPQEHVPQQIFPPGTIINDKSDPVWVPLSYGTAREIMETHPDHPPVEGGYTGEDGEPGAEPVNEQLTAAAQEKRSGGPGFGPDPYGSE